MREQTYLCYTMTLWIEDSRHAELNDVEHRNDFQYPVIERWTNEILPHQ